MSLPINLTQYSTIEGLGAKRIFSRITCFEINEVSNLCHSFGIIQMVIKFMLEKR